MAASAKKLDGLKEGCNQRPLYVRATLAFDVLAKDVPKFAYMYGESSRTHLPRVEQNEPGTGNPAFQVVVTTPGNTNDIVTVQMKGGSMIDGNILKTVIIS